MTASTRRTCLQGSWFASALLLVCLWGSTTVAQESGDDPERATSDESQMQVQVRVVRSTDDGTKVAVSEQGVVLKAIRPGRQQQRVVQEWEGVTDGEGIVRFDISRGKLGRAAALRAVTTHMSVPFRSKPSRPSDDSTLTIQVADPGGELEDVAVRRLRTVVEPWEGYLVISQFWRLTAEGNRVVDTSKLDVDERATGLPLEFPTNAEGLEATGPGESEVVEGTVYWRGRLKPGRATRLRVRYSMPVEHASYVYRQRVDYPVREAQVILPLRPTRTTIDRLDDAALVAPGFESVEATTRISGLRRDNEYLFASGRTMEPGETLTFELEGLPYSRPVGPWVAVGFAALGLLVLGAVARRESARFTSESERREARRQLEDERDRLADEIARLDRSYEEGRIDEVDYETERLRLREQLAVVLRRLRDLDGDR